MLTVGDDWIFVPKLFPYTKKQVLQYIIWLPARNLSRNRLTMGSRLCLTYLNAKAIVLDNIFGAAEFFNRQPLIATFWAAGRNILKGDIKTLRLRLGQHIYTFRHSSVRSITYK